MVAHGPSVADCIPERTVEERNRLVVEHLRLVPYVAHRWFSAWSGSQVFDDLLSAGNLALVGAVAAWRPDRGKISTYCIRRIHGAILDELQRIGRAPVCAALGEEEWSGIGPAEEAERADEAHHLADAVERLSDPDRRVLRHFLAAGESASLAREMGVSRQYVHQCLERGIASLKRLVR